jgi:hypothetical protein
MRSELPANDPKPPGCNVRQSRNFTIGAFALLFAGVIAYLIIQRL